MKGSQPSTPPDSRALIEQVLDLSPAPAGPTGIFTNAYPLWRPPGNRGVFGGVLIAQTLAAAQKTVSPNILVRSMHCYFVFAGDGELPVLYHVERLSDHPDSVVRSVQVRQGEQVIFTATVKFSQNQAAGKAYEHAVSIPSVDPPVDTDSGWDSDRPFQAFTAGFDGLFFFPWHPNSNEARCQKPRG